MNIYPPAARRDRRRSAQGSDLSFFQLVPEPKTVKNRVHLDLRCDFFETEVERLTALGASVLEQHEATSSSSIQKATSSACHGRRRHKLRPSEDLNAKRRITRPNFVSVLAQNC